LGCHVKIEFPSSDMTIDTSIMTSYSVVNTGFIVDTAGGTTFSASNV